MAYLRRFYGLKYILQDYTHFHMTEFRTIEINKSAVSIFLDGISGKRTISAYMIIGRCCNGTRSFSDLDGHSYGLRSYRNAGDALDWKTAVPGG